MILLATTTWPDVALMALGVIMALGTLYLLNR
jgi:hypothetical protein